MRVEIVDGPVTRPLRRRVLRPEQTDDQPMPGDDTPGTVHLAAYDGTVLVGSCYVVEEPCTWRPDDLPAWRLRGVATDATRQSQGIGAVVVTAARDYVVEQGGVLLWCHARIAAERFYMRLGWNPHGEEYLEAGRPHRDMWWPLG